jgi:Flp pilus assembly pilin Flp
MQSSLVWTQNGGTSVKAVCSRLLRPVLSDTRGVTALEYGVLAAFIMATVAATIWRIGATATNLFTTASDSL